MLTLWIISLDWKLTNNFLVLHLETTNSWFLAEIHSFLLKIHGFQPKSMVFMKSTVFCKKSTVSVKNHGFWPKSTVLWKPQFSAKNLRFLQKICSFWLIWLCHNEAIQSWFMKWIIIWDRDWGSCGVCVSMYTLPGQSINYTNFIFCQYITLCPQLMSVKYLVYISCSLWLAPILVKVWKWLFCGYH